MFDENWINLQWFYRCILNSSKYKIITFESEKGEKVGRKKNDVINYISIALLMGGVKNNTL